MLKFIIIIKFYILSIFLKYLIKFGILKNLEGNKLYFVLMFKIVILFIDKKFVFIKRFYRYYIRKW